MLNLYRIYFERDGERITPDQRVYAETPRDAMIEAGAILTVQAPATAVIREVA